ncbi:MAG: hypothetical protein ABR567_01555, partial [Myxococcales bacterium]
MKWVGIAVVALAAAAFLLRPRPVAFDMKAKLAEIAKNEGTWDNQWDHAKEKIAELEAGLAKERDPIKIFQIRREIARHQLYEGTNEEAIAGFQSLLDEYRAQMPPPAAEALEGELAFAWFRLGETENCAMHHNADSCLLPIRRGGMHHLPRGSTEAVKRYAALLADPAIDSESAYSYRWLLNLGYMTLGGYPEKVPKQWLIPPAAFASGSDIGRFEDVAA